LKEERNPNENKGARTFRPLLRVREKEPGKRKKLKGTKLLLTLRRTIGVPIRKIQVPGEGVPEKGKGIKG